MQKPKLKLEPLPFEEAIDYFKDKVPMYKAQYAKLAKEYQGLAFTVAGISSLDIINDVFQELQKAIEEGLTPRMFADNINAILKNKGWEGLTPYRIDNIFRTNIQTAYAVGQYRRMTDPDVIKARPYWMYDAVNDHRTRPTHKALDGMVYPAEHPFWDTWYPPNGYRCRCTVRSLSERDVKRKKLTVLEEIPKMVEPPGMPARPLNPDPGFSTNPAKVKWEPDMEKYPKSLQFAYQKKVDRANQQRGP